MKRLCMILATLIVLFLLAAAGCGGGGGDKAEVVNIGVLGDIMTLDPQVAEDTNSVRVYAQIYSKLVDFDENMNIIPDVAISWKPVSDSSVEFKLRDDVTFSNGEKLTSEDVAFTLDRAVNSKMMSFLTSFLATATDANGVKTAVVDTPDDYTVIVHTKEPYSPTVSVFADPAMGIVCKKAVEAAGADYESHPVGSGPYKFVERVTGDHILLEANPNYYKGAPKVAKLNFRIIPEAAQRTIGLQKGEIDIAYDIVPNDREKIKETKGRSVVQSDTLACNYLVVNVNRPELADVRVRQALNISIDRPSIVDSIANKCGEPATNMIAPKVFGFDASIPAIEYNMDKAKALMKEAGFDNGFEITALVQENQLSQEILQVIQSQWAQLGIAMSIEVLEAGSFYDKAGNYEFDVVYCNWTTSTGDADYTLHALLHSSNSGIPSFRTYANSDLDNYLDEARKTFDIGERKAYYAKALELINDEVPVISIYYPMQINGFKDNIKGFVPSPTLFHWLYGLELAK